MKKYIKTFLKILAIATLFFGIMDILNPTGVLTRTRIRTDFLRQYGDYLQYSLGDFELLDAGEGIFCDSTNFSARWWSVQFIDENGVEQTFGFNNVYSMGDFVARHVGNIASETLSNHIENHYLMTLDHINRTSSRLKFQADQSRNMRDYDRLTDPYNGIQIRYFLDARILLDE